MSTESNKHIVLITPGFAQDEADTTCITALQLFALELKQRGYEVSIIALQYPFRKSTYSWNGIPVYPLNGGNRSWKKVFLFFSLNKVFNEISKKRKIDQIHSFWLNDASLFAHRLAKKNAVPLITSAMGQDTRPENDYLRRILKKSIQTTSTCRFQFELLQKSGINDSKIIPWGVNQANKIEKDIDIIGAGNLTDLKNFKYFIRLCSELTKYRNDFKAVIVGVGVQEEILRAEIEKLGLNKSVRLVGQKSYEETLRLIASSRVLVHPSSYEGFGMTVIEGLASQTHVLATPVGIAANDDRVHDLKANLDQDAEKLNALLNEPLPESVFYDIKDTVDLFLEAYQGL